MKTRSLKSNKTKRVRRNNNLKERRELDLWFADYLAFLEGEEIDAKLLVRTK